MRAPASRRESLRPARLAEHDDTYRLTYMREYSLNRVAVVQAAPVFMRLEETLAKVERLAREAAANGAQVLLFPESFIPAYPRGLHFGAPVGSRSEAGRNQWLEYWRNALPLPGEAADFLGDLARREKLYLATGATERDEPGYSLYCSLLYFSPEGRLLARHRKIKPTAAERILWAEGAGDDLRVLPTPHGRIGGLICWENFMPLARQTLYAQHVELYLAPTADDRDSWQAAIRHIACEGRCFVLAANQYTTIDDYPGPWREALADPALAYCRGGSAIVDPYGRYLAGPLFDAEGILYADLDLETLIKAKMDFDPIGHYARDDVFSHRWLKNE
jgi:nitrilase